MCACVVCIDGVCLCNQAAEHFVIIPNRNQLHRIAVRERVEVDKVENGAEIATARPLNTRVQTTFHYWVGVNGVYGAM